MFDFIDVVFFDIKDIYRTVEGYLDIPATIAKSGIQEYNTSEPFLSSQLETFPKEFQAPNKTIRVLRPRDEVFNKKSMESFRNKPVTNDHPPKLISAKDTKEYAVGFSDSSITRLDDRLRTKLTLWDGESINEVEKGKRQISAGYKADLVFESGNDPDYGPYDAKFTNIIGNHIAIVQYGRAGATVKIGDKKPKGEKITMAKRTIGNVEVEIDDSKVGVVDALLKETSELKKAVVDHLETIDAKEKEITDAKKETEKVKGEKDVLEAKINDGENLDKLVDERIKIIDTAKSIIKDFDSSKKSDKEIKVETLKVKIPDMDFSEKSDDYINAAFDMLALDTGKNNSNKKEINDALNKQNTGNDNESLTDKARAAFIADSKTAYLGSKKEVK